VGNISRHSLLLLATCLSSVAGSDEDVQKSVDGKTEWYPQVSVRASVIVQQQGWFWIVFHQRGTVFQSVARCSEPFVKWRS